MANSNAPSGLRLARNADGSPVSGSLQMYYVASIGTSLYEGDPVILSGSADANGVPGVTIATAGTTNRWTGTVAGIIPSPSLVANGNYLPSGTNGYVLVAEGPNVIYEVQEDSVGGALAAANVGQNINLIAGSGNTIQGSGWMIDSSSAGTGATLQARLLGLAVRPDNEFGDYAKWLVRINLPTETGAAGSTGV